MPQPLLLPPELVPVAASSDAPASGSVPPELVCDPELEPEDDDDDDDVDDDEEPFPDEPEELPGSVP